MIEQLAQGFVAHFTVWAMFYSVLGVSLGLFFGAMPGLNQGVLMALTLPLTFYMDSNYAQFLLIGMYVGGVSGSMVTGVTLGIPGSPSSVMTTFDGHGLAKKGRASEALALGVTASFVAGMISWVILATISVPLARFAITLTGFEFSALIFGGLLMIASAGGGNFWKGLIAGFMGVLVALVGLDPVSNQSRFTFGIEKFDNGFSIFPVMLGHLCHRPSDRRHPETGQRAASGGCAVQGPSGLGRRCVPLLGQPDPVLAHWHMDRHPAGDRG